MKFESSGGRSDAAASSLPRNLVYPGRLVKAQRSAAKGAHANLGAVAAGALDQQDGRQNDDIKVGSLQSGGGGV